MLPSAHYNCVGVLIASFRSSIPSPPIPLFTLRCEPRGSTTQNLGPSGSLILSRRNSSSPASYRFSPAHCNGDISPTTPDESHRSAFYRLTRCAHPGSPCPSLLAGDLVVLRSNHLATCHCALARCRSRPRTASPWDTPCLSRIPQFRMLRLTKQACQGTLTAPWGPRATRS